MNPIHRLIQREPAILIGAMVALLQLAIAFGLPLTTEQHDAILKATNALLVLAGALLIRSRVSPVEP